MTILDTNVVSELMRPAPTQAVLRWFQSQPEDEWYVSAITVAEILYGIELLPQGKRRDALFAGAEKMFSKVFAGHILACDEETARAFPPIAAARRRGGRPISEMDALIAATAVPLEALLATRNTDDFEECGVRLINPWEA